MARPSIPTPETGAQQPEHRTTDRRRSPCPDQVRDPSPQPAQSQHTSCTAAGRKAFGSSDHEAQFIDLGPDYYASRTHPERKVRNHIRELRALGYSVTLNPAA